MCGICGMLGLVDKNLLRRMCDVIHHRGPDDSGLFMDEGIGLGHKRLSIIDLKTGHQPIYNEDESIVIVYNGEIYNFKELREQLEKEGHTFYTSSDTEVIIHLYEDFGERCVKKLRGMFAFAIWDSNKRKLILARDRLGIKPLYYTFFNGILLFGSEIKSILQYEEIKKKVDLKALHDFLTFCYIPAPRTMFNGIKKLPQGCILVYENENIKIQKYWNVELNPNQNFNEDYYVNKLKKLLEESVKIRLMSEVPLGAFLSGGLDSSTVVAIMSSLMDEPVKTISAVFEDAKYDESNYAKIVAEHFETEHHEVVINAKDIRILPKIIWHFDEPTLDASAIPEYLISEKAKKYVTVVLVGEGADEIFLGYDQYKLIPRIYAHKRLFPIAKRMIPIFSLFSKFPFRKVRRYADFIAKIADSLDDPKETYKAFIERFTEREKERLVRNFDFDRNENVFNKYFVEYYTKDRIIKSISLFDMNVTLPDMFLINVDKMTMAHSIEARVPFLDHKLVEFANTIPLDLKLKGSEEKYILKKAMKDALPKEILNRRKHPFIVPIVDWFEEDLKELAEQLLSEENIRKQGYFNYDFVKKVLSKKNPNYNQPLALVYFELWHKIFIESDNIYKPRLELNKII